MIKNMFKEAFNLEWDTASPEEIHESIINGSKIKGTNLCILICAILIASIGLNMNSTAVIIGAMLISPLMGGIMAIGYGLATNDLRFARNAALRLSFQVLISICTSTVYFYFSPISNASSELLARTRPTVWDVLIAIFGGLAGVIGVTRKDKSNVIPGVAIATALMPPLCTAGYGIAHSNIKYFLGAIYLFFINSFFICLATTLVILATPCITAKTMVDKKAKRKLHINMFLIAVVTIIPSVILACQIVSDSILDNNVKKYLDQEFSFSDTQIVQSSLDKNENIIEVAVIGKSLDAKTIDMLERKLNNYDLSKMTLKVTQTELSQGVTSDEVKALLDENSNTVANEVSLALKTQEVDELNQKLEKAQSEKEALEAQIKSAEDDKLPETEILTELKTLYPSITSAGIGYETKLTNESPEKILTLTLYFDNENLFEQETLNTISDWLKLKCKTTDLIQVKQEQIPSFEDTNSTQTDQSTEESDSAE